MRWEDIKIATLQKMAAAEGNSIPTDNSAEDYLAAMPQACNEALQLLSTANKFIIKSVQIIHLPIYNLLSDETAQKTYKGSEEFSAEGAQSYYFEGYGQGKAQIYVGDLLQKTISINASKGYWAYRGLIPRVTDETVTIKFTADYPLSVKNIALYAQTFKNESEVSAYGRFTKYRLRDYAVDFFMIDDMEVYREDSDGYGKCDFDSEQGDILVLGRDKPGTYTIYYKAYPPQITASTPDDYELPVANEVAVLLPLYMASQIYKDDDISIATTYRNEFEVARELLYNPIQYSDAEYIESESGWI